MTSRVGLALLVARYWQRRWGRAVMMLLGVVLGVGLLIAVLLVDDTVVNTFNSWSLSVAGGSQIEITPLPARDLTQAQVDAVRLQPGVAEAAAVIVQRSHLFRAESTIEANVRGVEPAAEELLRPRSMLSGRFLSAADHDVTVLSETAAEALDVNLGSVVELLTPYGLKALTVVGIYRDDKVGIPVRERVALITLNSAQEAFFEGRDSVTRIDVAVSSWGQLGSLRAADVLQAGLNQLLEGTAQVQQVNQVARELTESSRGLRSMLLLVAVLTLVAAAGLITSNGLALVAERSADAAALSALGVSRRLLSLWRCGEVSALLVAGVVPGVLLGILTARGLMTHLPGTYLTPYAVAPGLPRISLSGLLPGAVVAALAAVLLAVLTAVLMRGLMAGIAERLLRVEGAPLWLRLAAGAVGRHRWRSSVSAAALLLTVAGLVGVHGAFDSSRRSLITWLDSAVTWDLMVGGSDGGLTVQLPLSQATLEGVAGLPEVREAAPERQVILASAGRGLPVIALESGLLSTQQRLRVVHSLDAGLAGEVKPDGPILEGEGAVALSVPLAKRLNLGVGDQIPFTTQDGERAYTVTALVDDRAGAAETAYLNLSDYAATWQDSAIDAIAVRLQPGNEAADVAATLAQRSLEAGIDPRLAPQVALAEGYRAELLASVADTYGLVRTLAVLAVLVALIALINNAVVASWQLREQSSALRSLGAPLRLLNATLLAESAMSAAVGVTAGIGVGTVLSWQIADLMSGAIVAHRYVPVDAYLLSLLLVASASAAAALLAGSRLWKGVRSTS